MWQKPSTVKPLRTYCKIRNNGPDNKYHQVRELRAGGGFISFGGPSLHFGLGKHEKVNKIEIFWSTGEHQAINQPFKAGRSYQLERL